MSDKKRKTPAHGDCESKPTEQLDNAIASATATIAAANTTVLQAGEDMLLIFSSNDDGDLEMAHCAFSHPSVVALRARFAEADEADEANENTNCLNNHVALACAFFAWVDGAEYNCGEDESLYNEALCYLCMKMPWRDRSVWTRIRSQWPPLYLDEHAYRIMFVRTIE